MASSFIKIGFITTGLILSLSSTTSFAKEYYKWVDAKGSTHYSTTPPPKSAMKKGKVNTYGATQSYSKHSGQENNNVKETENKAQENKPAVSIPKIPESSSPAAAKAE